MCMRVSVLLYIRVFPTYLTQRVQAFVLVAAAFVENYNM